MKQVQYTAKWHDELVFFYLAFIAFWKRALHIYIYIYIYISENLSLNSDQIEILPKFPCELHCSTEKEQISNLKCMLSLSHTQICKYTLSNQRSQYEHHYFLCIVKFVLVSLYELCHHIHF